LRGNIDLLDFENAHRRKEETYTPEIKILSKYREENDEQVDYLDYLIQINFLFLRKRSKFIHKSTRKILIDKSKISIVFDNFEPFIGQLIIAIIKISTVSSRRRQEINLL